MLRKAFAVLALAVCAGCLLSLRGAPERALPSQPFPDAAEYADAARSLAAGDGFVTRVHDGARQPPRYPPGFSMALTPFASVGDYPRNVQRGAKVYAMVYVLAAVIAAWVLGGPLAAALAGAFVWSSPFARESAGLVLSDAFVAALAVITLALLAPIRVRSTRLAAALGGVAALSRLTAGLQVIALLAATPRTSWRRVLLFVAPSLLVLALVQWAVFGSPLTTGYDYWGVADHVFSASYLTDTGPREGPFIIADRLDGELLSFTCPCPVGGPQSDLSNLFFYPALLAGGFWVFAPPMIGVVGLVTAVRRRREPVGRYALVLVGGSLVLFWVYRFQGTRFMAGPATVLTVLGAVGLADAGRALARRVRGRTTPAAA